MKPAYAGRRFIFLTTLVVLLRLGIGGGIARADPDQEGKWDPPIQWPNVAIHLHVLPNGKVLFWGRREWNANGKPEKLDPQDCVPRLWDPASGAFHELPKPGFNLFCSGHAFLPDGRLLVAGGHKQDGVGETFSIIFDFKSNTWVEQTAMNDGRWYPTVASLADGSAIVSSGSIRPDAMNNSVQQLWSSGAWKDTVTYNLLPLYPWMHIARDGRVFMSGPLQRAQFLSTAGTGDWQETKVRLGPQREYGCSVMFDVGKVMLIGGGRPPVADVEVIDLNDPQSKWRLTKPISVARRQHNATILPDGTVLVTGGTSGDAFNDLSQTVRHAERWDPGTENWAKLASESVDRAYHSTAVLLPDGRVLSAGGGEYRPNNVDTDPTDPDFANQPTHSHRDAQLFSPPYLFNGERPAISEAPTEVKYGQAFAVKTPQANDIADVTWVRLSSVTHSWNMNQRFNRLEFVAGSGIITVSAPDSANVCPPGHYMLFLLNTKKVPSVAAIVRIDVN